MKINVTQPCPTCRGAKKQVHPSWLKLYHLRRHAPTLKTADYFLELGYLPNEQRPPIVIDCRRCRATGEVEAWVPLEVFLPRFIEAFRRMTGGQAA